MQAIAEEASRRFAAMTDGFIPGDYTVVIVDEDAASREQICGLLARVGYRTRGYASAEELLEAVDESFRPACVITELSLPGMDGVDLTRCLRSRDRLMPVIIVTRHSDVAAAVGALRASVSDYLMKPVVERDLINRLRAVLTRHFAATAG